MGFWDDLFREEEEEKKPGFWDTLFADDWKSAALPQDEINTDLSLLERLASTGDRYQQSVSSALTRGALGAGERIANVPTMAMDLAAGVAPGALGDELDFIASNMRRQGLESRDIHDEMVPVPEPEGKIERTIQDVARSTPEMVGTIASGFVNPALPFAISGGLSGADAYERTRNLGGGRAKSAVIGAAEGAAIGALERFGLEDAARAMRAVPAGSRTELASKILKSAGVNLGVEGSTEAVQEVVSLLGEYAGGRSWDEIKSEAAERIERSAFAGAAAGAGFSPVTTIAADRLARREIAEPEIPVDEVAPPPVEPPPVAPIQPTKRLQDFTEDDWAYAMSKDSEKLAQEAREALQKGDLDGVHKALDGFYLQTKVDQAFGIRNKHAFEEMAPSADVVVYYDLDDFKAVNDTLGHDAGDAVILAAVEELKTVAREQETPVTPFRPGGDELAMLVSGMSVEQAQSLAESLQNKFAESIVEYETADGPEARKGFGLSIGVGRDKAEADARLLENKAYRVKAGLRHDPDISRRKLLGPTVTRVDPQARQARVDSADQDPGAGSLGVQSPEELDWELLPQTHGTASQAVVADLSPAPETPFSKLGFELVPRRENEAWDEELTEGNSEGSSGPITHYTVDTPDGEYRIEKIGQGKKFKYRVISPGGLQIGTDFSALGKNSDKGAYGAIRNRFAEADQGVIDLPDGNLWVKGIAKPFQVVETDLTGVPGTRISGYRVVGADGQVGGAVFNSREDAKQFLKDYAAGLQRGEVVIPGQYEGSPEVFRPADLKSADQLLDEALEGGVTGEDIDSAFAPPRKPKGFEKKARNALRWFVRNMVHDKDEYAHIVGRLGLGDYEAVNRPMHYLYSGETVGHHLYQTPSVIEQGYRSDQFKGSNTQTVSVADSPTLHQKAAKIATEAEPEVLHKVLPHFDREPVSWRDAIRGLTEDDIIDNDNPQKAGPLAKVWMARRIRELVDDPVRTRRGKLKLLDINEGVAKEFLAYEETLRREDPERHRILLEHAEKLTQAGVDTILKPRLQAGLISSQEFVNMVSKGLAWAPMRKQMEEEDSITGYAGLGRRNRGVSPKLHNLRKGAEEGVMLNPIFEAMGMGGQTWRAITKENLKKFTAQAIDNNPVLFNKLGLKKIGPGKPPKKLSGETFAVHEDGKPIYYQVPKGVGEVIEYAGPEWTKTFWELMETPVGRFGLTMPMRVLKTGVTTGWNFIWRNPVKDTVSTFMNAHGVGFIPVYDTLMGTLDIATGGKLDRKINDIRESLGLQKEAEFEGGFGNEAMVQGGSQATHVGATIGDLEIQGQKLQDLLYGERYRDHIQNEWKKFTGKVKKGHLSALAQPFQFFVPFRRITTTEGTDFTTSGWARALEEFSQMVEMGNRAGVMRRAMRGKVWNRADRLTLDEAIHQVREGPGVDFRRAGAAGRGINAFGEEFYNPTIQDVDKVYRMINNPKTRTEYLGKVFLAMGIPMIANLMGNVFTDDEERREAYSRVPETHKAFLFHVSYNKDDGTWFTLPRIPGFWSVMQYATERSVRGLAGYGMSTWGDLKEAFENHLPVEYISPLQNVYKLVMPPVYEAADEVRNNWNEFMERPVVPSHLERLQPSDRYTERTNPLFRTIAQVYNPIADKMPLSPGPVTPMGLEHLYNRSTGTTGKLLADTAAKGARHLGLYEDMPNIERGRHEGYSTMPSPTVAWDRLQQGNVTGALTAMTPGTAFGKPEALGWNSQPVKDLYTISETVEQAANSIRNAQKNRDIQKAQEIAASFDHDPLKVHAAFERAKRRFTVIGNEQKQILNSDMPEEQKVARLRELDERLTEEAEIYLRQFGFYRR